MPTPTTTQSAPTGARQRPRNRHSAGLGLGGALGIIAASLIVGLILTVSIDSLSWISSAIFALGALAATTLVAHKWLYLTVASIPPIYAAFAIVTGWAKSIGSLPPGASKFSMTTLLTSVYPLLERFPALITVFLACCLLAVLRLWAGGQNARIIAERETAARRAASEANHHNTKTAVRARERSGSLSVAELAARAEAERRAAAEAGATGGRRGRIGERDREARRQQQAAERAARARIARAQRESKAMEEEHARRVARFQEQNPAPAAPATPAAPAAEAPQTPQAPLLKQPNQPEQPRRSLDDNLYES